MKPQRVYGGAHLLGAGPSLRNISIIDHNALPMIAQMMKTGLQVDLSHFAAMERTLVDDMDRITAEVQEVAGHYVNLDSGDQVSKLLFKELGLKQARPKLTKSGDRESVEDEVLTAIQHDHAVVPLILNHKELSKLKGTYVSPMPRLARRTSFGKWRVYPNFGTTRVPSGRLNCKSPNLLAMPSRTERGRDIRKGFITDRGWTYLSVDESQIEPRVVAHRSEDPALMSVYFNNEDIYSDFAIAAFSLPDKRYKDEKGKWQYPGVDKNEHRFPSKTCILAAIYDVSPQGLLEQMPIVCANCKKEATKHDCRKFVATWTENKCEDILNRFYMKYPGILTMRKMDHRRARTHGLLWDEWGRILHIAAVRSVHPWVVSAALREAGNYPIQATAQGTIKLVMAQVHDEFEEAGLYDVFHPLLQIHDEILGEVREDMAQEIAEHIKMRFETCVKLRVPIKASAAIAPTWGSLEK